MRSLCIFGRICLECGGAAAAAEEVSIALVVGVHVILRRFGNVHLVGWHDTACYFCLGLGRCGKGTRGNGAC